MRKIVISTALMMILLSMGCTKREDLVVADVAGRKITVGNFEEVAEVMEDKYLPTTDDLEGKKELLTHMINKEVMALKAYDVGYEKEQSFVETWAVFRGPFLINAMQDQLVRKKVTVSEEEVEEYYAQMHYEYGLSQIVVREEDEAWDIKERITAGGDFAELAKQYSLGAEANNGGFVGTNNVGRILWWVEEALFEMKEGEVSEPLRTSTGWALLKVHSVREVPPLFDKEYARKRVRAIKEKKGIEALKAEIEKEIQLTFYPDAVEIAYESLPDDIDFGDIIDRKVTRENAPKVEIPEKFLDKALCDYVDGVYTLKDFAEYYDQMGLPERPRRQYGKDNVVQAMHMKVFDKVLPIYAEQKAKVLDIPEVHKIYKNKKEEFLVHFLYSDNVKSKVAVTTREVEDYYSDHKEEMTKPEKRSFEVALLDGQEKARDIAGKAAAGKDLSVLARDAMGDAGGSDNFESTDLVVKGNYPDYDDVAFSLEKEGEVSEPFEVPRGWAVVRLKEIQKAEEMSLEEAMRPVRMKLMEDQAEEMLLQLLEEWREDYDISINDKNLDKAVLTRTRML